MYKKRQYIVTNAHRALFTYFVLLIASFFGASLGLNPLWAWVSPFVLFSVWVTLQEGIKAGKEDAKKGIEAPPPIRTRFSKEELTRALLYCGIGYPLGILMTVWFPRLDWQLIASAIAFGMFLQIVYWQAFSRANRRLFKSLQTTSL